MSFLDEAIYERSNSIERESIAGRSDDEDNSRDPLDVLGIGDDEKPNAEKVEPKKVKRRVNVVRLNPEKLTGPRGIHTIENEFKNIKYKGKGHEKEDLDMIMKRLSHWAHRLFPKYNFDDCLMAIETQGKKKPVQNFLNKYRNNALDDEVVQNVLSDSDEEHENDQRRDLEMPNEFDEMDQMLSEQISKTSYNFNNTIDSDLGVRELDMTRSSISSQKNMVPQASSTLTEEQIKMIEENKRKALDRLKNRRLGLTQPSNSNSNQTVPTESPLLIQENPSNQLEKTIITEEEDIDMSDLIPVDPPNYSKNPNRVASPSAEDLELLQDMDD